VVVLLSFPFQRECAFGGVGAIFNQPLEEQQKTQRKLDSLQPASDSWKLPWSVVWLLACGPHKLTHHSLQHTTNHHHHHHPHFRRTPNLHNFIFMAKSSSSSVTTLERFLSEPSQYTSLDLEAGGDGRAACSLLVQAMEWELREQKGWQRPCNETPPSPHWTWVQKREVNIPKNLPN